MALAIEKNWRSGSITIYDTNTLNGVALIIDNKYATRMAAVDDLLEALIEVEQMVHAGEINQGTMDIVSQALAKARETQL